MNENTNTKTLIHGLPISGHSSRQLQATITTTRGYFSVTGEISNARQRARGDAECCGYIHDEILRTWPKLKPLVGLHLSDLRGIPMHAEADGWYWLAGASGGLGESYHGGSDKTPEECLKIFSDYLRIGLTEASEMQARAASGELSRREFNAYVESQKPRWSDEALAGIELIKSL